jgi:mannose-6-phosphate isomerase-like protein (cupin superfamily)
MDESLNFPIPNPNVRLPFSQRSLPAESDERPWGSWTLLYEAEGIKVKLIEVQPGHRLSLQYHHYRSEHWTCIAGRATAQVGDDVFEVEPRGSVEIPLGMLHRLSNLGSEPVQIVEVQRGRILREDDIVRVEDDYHRSPAHR